MWLSRRQLRTTGDRTATRAPRVGSWPSALASDGRQGAVPTSRRVALAREGLEPSLFRRPIGSLVPIFLIYCTLLPERSDEGVILAHAHYPFQDSPRAAPRPP